MVSSDRIVQCGLEGSWNPSGCSNASPQELISGPINLDLPVVNKFLSLLDARSIVRLASVRSKDRFPIPRAGLEIAPIGGLASINVNGSVGPEHATKFLGTINFGWDVRLCDLPGNAHLTASRSNASSWSDQSSHTNRIDSQDVMGIGEGNCCCQCRDGCRASGIPMDGIPSSVLGLGWYGQSNHGSVRRLVGRTVKPAAP